MHFVAFCFWWRIISPSEVWACAESTIEIVFWDLSDTVVSTFPFRFPSSSPLSSIRFLTFFSLLLSIYCRIRCLKKQVGGGTRFSSEFTVQLYMIFSLFLWPPQLNHAHSGIVWKISSPAQVSWHCCPWPCQGQLRANGFIRSWIWRWSKIQGVHNAYSIITGVTYFSCEFYG